MSKPVDLRDKKKPRSAREAAKRAYEEHFRITPVEDEPEGLASGKTAEDGSFILEEEENDEIHQPE